jgi:predicted nucleic acid-binding protein
VRGILDTSVFIAKEQGHALAADRLPDESAISVVTLAELELGVHTAGR